MIRFGVSGLGFRVWGLGIRVFHLASRPVQAAAKEAKLSDGAGAAQAAGTGLS